jgi:hypothetical protein
LPCDELFAVNLLCGESPYFFIFCGEWFAVNLLWGESTSFFFCVELFLQWIALWWMASAVNCLRWTCSAMNCPTFYFCGELFAVVCPAVNCPCGELPCGESFAVNLPYFLFIFSVNCLAVNCLAMNSHSLSKQMVFSAMIKFLQLPLRLILTSFWHQEIKNNQENIREWTSKTKIKRHLKILEMQKNAQIYVPFWQKWRVTDGRKDRSSLSLQQIQIICQQT